MSSAVLLRDYYVTEEDYLAAERISESKHEYLAGVIYAMAGASRDHVRITGNIHAELLNQLRGKPCEPFAADMRVRIKSGPATFYYYPDVVVDCSGKGDKAVEEPAVIFEVMSPATERIDRGEKLANYQSLPSLEAYVLVDQFHAIVTVYRRQNMTWTVEVYAEKSEFIEFPGIGCSLSLATMYERMHF